MGLLIDQFLTHARIQFSRHLRSPAIWVLALAAPIAARFLVPEQGAGYTIMAVNDSYLSLDSAVIGLQLGVVMAIILTPLAYIFLRAGPTRRQPWQADDLTPARRSAQMLGHWVADTGALWILMSVLALAGIVLSIFRLPLSEVNPLMTALCLFLIAAPALAVIAGLRTIFSTRRALRGAWGDALFFCLWIALISVTAAFFKMPGASPLLDVFGFAAPISAATDVDIHSLYIGGAPSFDESLKIDALAGVTTPAFLFSRVFWIVFTGGLVALAGRFYATHKFKLVRKTARKISSGPSSFTDRIVAPVEPGASFLPLFVSEARLALQPKWLALALIAIALGGGFLPFRGMVGPALALLLIFPLTRHGARWRGPEMAKLTALTAIGRSDVVYRLGATIALCALLCLPAACRMLLTGETAEWADIVAIAVGLPLIAISLGHVTRSAFTGRLILLILWYGYLNL